MSGVTRRDPENSHEPGTIIPTATAPHTHDAADITSGLVGTARLGTGVADNTKFLRGDQTWAAGGGGGASDLASLTDVDVTGVVDGSTLVYDAGLGKWIDSPTPLFVRADVATTTGSIADLAEATGTIALGKGGMILKCVVDRAARVRLYRTSAYRTADASRPIGTDPTGEHGVICDLNIVAGNLTLDLSPVFNFANGDGPAVTNIYYAIQNRSGSTSTVAVTFTVIRLE